MPQETVSPAEDGGTQEGPGEGIGTRVAYLTEGPTVKPEDLGLLAPMGETDSGVEYDAPLAEATHQFQRDHITRAIDREAGNVTAAAEALGVHRSNLYRKMRQLGMNVGEE